MKHSLSDLYKIESDEFLQVEYPSKLPPKTPINDVKKKLTSKPSHLTVIDRMKGLGLNQNKIAKSADVKRQVVNNFLKGRFFKKSSPQNKLILWLFNNGFRDCFIKKGKEKRITCTCPHCGAKHRAITPFKKKRDY